MEHITQQIAPEVDVVGVGEGRRAFEAVTPLGVLERAVASGASVDVLERLLVIHERWEATQARHAFEAAMARLREDLPTIVKTCKVDYTSQKGRTHYKYEDLAAVTEAISPALSKHGLSFRWQTDSTKPDQLAVTCIVSHERGHSERTTLSAGVDNSGGKNDIQALGSAVTYLQRYTLKAALGLAAARDDDGRDVTSAASANDDMQAQSEAAAEAAAVDRATPQNETHYERIARVKREASAKRRQSERARTAAPRGDVESGDIRW